MKKIHAQNSIEFIVIVVSLIMFALLATDIALYYRQTYLVQTIADETLQKLSSDGTCSSSDEVKNYLSSVVRSFYNLHSGNIPSFITRNVVAKYPGYIFISENSKGGEGEYVFSVICKNSASPIMTNFSYKYKGLFIFKSTAYINSNPAVNNIYY